MSGQSDESNEPTGEEGVDLRWVVSIFRRRFSVFFVVAAIIVLMTLAALMLLPNRYSTTTTLLLDRQKFEITQVDPALGAIPEDSASVDTEVQVLQSNTNLRAVVEKLKLTNDPEFNPVLSSSSFLDRAKRYVGGFLSPAEQVDARDAVGQSVTRLRDGIEVKRQGLTYVISISATTLDAAKSARIANTLAQTYIDKQVEAKLAAGARARDFLNSRLSGLAAEVQTTETEAQNVRARAGLPQTANQATFDQQAVSDLSSQLITLESDLAQKRSQLAVAQSAIGNPASLPAVVESNVIRDLKSRRAAALSTLADVTNRYGPRHPDTQKAKDQIASTDLEIAREMSNIVASLQQEVSAAQSRVSTVRGQLARQRSYAVSNSSSAVQVQQLDREGLASRSVYEDFLKRSRETSATADLADPDATIVSRAVPPAKPSSPNRAALLVAGLCAGAALGFLAVVIAELTDIKISSGSDVWRWLKLRRLVSIPDIALPHEIDSHALLVLRKPESSYTEAYRELSNLIFQRRQRVTAVNHTSGQAYLVMPVSAVPHEGKTAAACSLALSLSAAGQNVLLIDADIRRPQVMASLQLDVPDNMPPIGDVLNGTVPVSKALLAFPDQSLTILPLAGETTDKEMFRNGKFEELLQKVRSSYDFVVIDTAPVLALSDSRNLSHLADEVLLVTRWRRTSRFAARSAVVALEQSNAKITGVILNAVNLKLQSLYSRDDSLAFYASYKGYYHD
jgi:capsular exopolysaccharide synthesis family protein